MNRPLVHYGHVGKTIINHSPVITINLGGMVTIPSHGWFTTFCFTHIINHSYNHI